MKISSYSYFLLLCMLPLLGMAQEKSGNEKEQGHYNQSKFRQMYDEFSTPNMFRTASGAPGPAYYQQQADYKIDVTLDDKNAKLSGEEIITYTNNSPDNLEFLWLQLDQNVRSKDSTHPLRYGTIDYLNAWPK